MRPGADAIPKAWFEAFDLHLGIITRIRTLNEKGKCSMQ
jgi:hypothetical protein